MNSAIATLFLQLQLKNSFIFQIIEPRRGQSQENYSLRMREVAQNGSS
jgi:hypothetical protein